MIRQFLKRLLTESAGIDLVIDVGANESQFGQKIRTFYDGKILSFEPVSTTFLKLEKTAAGDPLWEIRKLALGNQAETKTINIYGHTDLSSFLGANKLCLDRFQTAPIAREEIAVRRLDQEVKIDDHSIFLKLDTQGYDLEAFKGASGILGSVKLLQSEISLISLYDGMPHWLDTLAVYESAGFKVAALFPVCRESARVVEFDCLMLKA
jgi:FkbM family methyltransferase